jgi:sugar/nucleoside kinase (ribokinase family)
VVDATGAGDAFAAGLLTALDPKCATPLADLDAVEKAVRAGHRAAAVVVGLLGAEPGAAGRKRLSKLGAEAGLE